MKRFIFLALACMAPVVAQQSSVSSTTSVDINGNRVQDGPQVTHSKSNGTSESTETMQSINGRMVPLERVEERVLRDDASGKVVERLIRRYDQQGNPTTPIKQTIEEQKRSDGSTSVQTTTYRGDINGGMQIIEKSVTETHKSDSSETSNTVVQRPNVNGGLDTVEKRDEVKVTQPNGYQTETTTYRNDGSGGFYVAVRQTDQHTQQGSQSTDNRAEYEVGPTRSLQLHSTVRHQHRDSGGWVAGHHGGPFRPERARNGKRQRFILEAVRAAAHREDARAQRYRKGNTERATAHGFRSGQPGAAATAFPDGLQGQLQEALISPSRGPAS